MQPPDGRRAVYPRCSAALVLFASLLLPFPVTAQAPGADPSINLPYQAPDFEQWRSRFERPGREVYDFRREILAATAPKPGMHIADIGTGTGLFTRLFADAVGPDGRVYAVDVAEEFVRNVEREAREAGHTNVVGRVNDQQGVGLAPDSIDLAFVADTYHHFERPAAMLASIRAALRPGGTLVVVDFERIAWFSSPWVMQHVRAGKEVFIEEILASGFVYEGEERFMQFNYFLRFRNPAQ